MGTDSAHDTAPEMQSPASDVAAEGQPLLAWVVEIGFIAVVLYFIVPAVLNLFDIDLEFGDNTLEKALVVGQSTRDDFTLFRDEGGLDNVEQNTWKGYLVTSVQLDFDPTNVLTTMVLDLPKNAYAGKLASFSNLKSTLSSMCPDNWTDNRSGNGQFSESDGRFCGMIENASKGTVEVTVSYK